MSVSVRLAQSETDYRAWNTLVLTSPCTSFYVTTSWLNAYTAFGMSTKYLMAKDSNDDAIGGAALAIYRMGPISWLYVPHGPFCRGNDDQTIVALLDEIEGQARRIGAAFVQIAPFERAPFDVKWQEIASKNSLPYSPYLPASAQGQVSQHLSSRGYHQRSLFSLLSAPSSGQIVDLTAGDILSTFQKRTIQYLRRTLDSKDVEAEQVSSLGRLRIAYELIRENTERYGGIYRPWPTFEAAVWPGIQNRYMLVLLASFRTEPCSAILVGFGGGIGTYISGGTRRDIDFGGVRPAHLLHYLAMQETRKRGFGEYDLTAIVGGGVGQFKRSFNPVYYRLQEPLSVILRPKSFRLYQIVNSRVFSDRSRMRRIAKIIYAGKSVLGWKG